MKTSTLRAALFAANLFTAAHAFSIEPAPPDYYPLKQAAKWYYKGNARGEEGHITKVVIETETIDGQNVATRAPVTSRDHGPQRG